jgi:hypothetical protein
VFDRASLSAISTSAWVLSFVPQLAHQPFLDNRKYQVLSLRELAGPGF